MSNFDIFSLVPLVSKLRPMLPAIEDAVAEFEAIASDPETAAAIAQAEKLLADPKLKQAIATGLKLADLLKQAQAAPSAAPPDSGDIANQ